MCFPLLLWAKRESKKNYATAQSRDTFFHSQDVYEQILFTGCLIKNRQGEAFMMSLLP